MTTFNSPQKQRGAVLALSLMILLVMTIVAISAMEGTTLGYKMSANAVYQDQAFNNAESGLPGAGDSVIEFLEYSDWKQVDFTGTGYTSKGNNIALAIDHDKEKIYENQTEIDLEFNDPNSDIRADISILRLGTSVNTGGSGARQLRGYHGAGVGAGGAGGYIGYYEFRSNGQAGKGSQAWNAVDFRYVP